MAHETQERAIVREFAARMCGGGPLPTLFGRLAAMPEGPSPDDLPSDIAKTREDATAAISEAFFAGGKGGMRSDATYTIGTLNVRVSVQIEQAGAPPERT